jgi:hypothetical protein
MEHVEERSSQADVVYLVWFCAACRNPHQLTNQQGKTFIVPADA